MALSGAKWGVPSWLLGTPPTATSAWPYCHWEEVMPLLLWLALLVEAPSVSST